MTEGKLVGTNPGIGHNVGDGPSLSPKQEAILEKGRKTLADVTAGYIQVNADRLRAPAQRVADAIMRLCEIEPPAGVINIQKIVNA